MKTATTLGIVWLVILVTAPAPAQTPEIPALTGPVVDAAAVIDPTSARNIETLARELRSKTGAEIALLTIGSISPLSPFDYGVAVLDAWELGRAERDDGLLLLVAVEDREARFFQGYGLEGILPDGRLGAILDTYVVPALRRGELGAGTYAGLRAAADVIAGDAGVTLDGSLPARSEAPRQIDVTSIVLLLFVLIVISMIVAEQAGVRGGRGHPPIFRGGYSGGFGSGGTRRGGFGGGFGGGLGGGGRFGGGGAGRSW